MGKMKVFNFDDLGPVREYSPPPERVIEGDIQCKSWTVDSDKDGKISTGVFESTPGINHSIKGEVWEYCSILSGIVEVTEEGGETVRFQAGDSFVLKPGFVGTWKTIETVRKIWIVAT